MRPNNVKRALSEGGIAIGTLVFEFGTTGIARIAAEAGAEFVLFDMEHTGWSIESIRMLIATTPSSIVPIIRVPATEYHFIARVLDIGTMGIMIPMVESTEQAERFVQYAKYPPVGKRGAAFGVAHDNYTGGNIVEKMKSANDEVLLIALIETVNGIKNVDAIAAVAGIDVLWIGHFDLTNSMGIPGEFDHPEFISAVHEVLEACRHHDKAAGFMAADIDTGQALLHQGFRMIGYGGDLWLYQQALAQGISALKLSKRDE